MFRAGSQANLEDELIRRRSSPKFVCVECSRPVDLLFRQYTRGIRLGRCDSCGAVADKYIECEFALIAIDLVLHRIQAYRHILFNRKPFSTHTFQDRLWQFGVAMAALDAHLRQTALFSDPPALDPCQRPHHLSTASPIAASSRGEAGDLDDVFRETAWLLLTSFVEHACFSAGVILWVRTCTFICNIRICSAPIAFSDESRRSPNDATTTKLGRASNEDGDRRTCAEMKTLGSTPSSPEISPPPLPSATKIYMAIVYPLFLRPLAGFVMIWDRQAAILNTIEILVATMQFVALTAVLEHHTSTEPGGSRLRYPGGVAATALAAGVFVKLIARMIFCEYLPVDCRNLALP